LAGQVSRYVGIGDGGWRPGSKRNFNSSQSKITITNPASSKAKQKTNKKTNAQLAKHIRILILREYVFTCLLIGDRQCLLGSVSFMFCSF
jgi:hypothetical protein